MISLATLEQNNSPPGYHRRYTAKMGALTIDALEPVIRSFAQRVAREVSTRDGALESMRV